MRKIWAKSKDRYRASAAQKRMYGGSTITEFWVGYAGDEHNAAKWVVVTGYGKTPGERKTDAMRRGRDMLESMGERDPGTKSKKPFAVVATVYKKLITKKVTPKGATKPRTEKQFAKESAALLVAKGCSSKKAKALVKRNGRVVNKAWKGKKAPCAVADRLGRACKRPHTRRDPHVEPQDADELVLWYESSDAKGYEEKNKTYLPAVRKKIAAGTYDAKKAPKLWEYALEKSARRYAKEILGDEKLWTKIFSKAERVKASHEVAKREYQRILSGEYGAVPGKTTRRDPSRSRTKKRTRDFGSREIIPVNANDASWTRHRYILAFGAYGDTLLMVWANGLEDGLDEAVDWLADHEPGLLMDKEVDEAYHRAIKEGMSEEKAQEEAEMDMTQAGNSGHYIASWEWTIVAEDPTRAQILELQGRPKHARRDPVKRAARPKRGDTKDLVRFIWNQVPRDYKLTSVDGKRGSWIQVPANYLTGAGLINLSAMPRTKLLELARRHFGYRG